MERIWRLFEAAIATVFAIWMLLICFVTCFWSGSVVAKLINWSLGGIGLPLRIPMTIMFSIAAGYIYLSILLGSNGYFDQKNATKIHRGATLGDARTIRERLSNSGSSQESENTVHAANFYDRVSEIFDQVTSIPSQLKFWRKTSRKPLKKPRGLK